MAKNESRRERRKAQESLQTKNKSILSKVYYWIIGFLFLMLLLLVGYIFANSGDNVDLGDKEETSSIVQREETDDEEDSSKDQTKEEETENIEEEPEEATEDEDKDESEDDLEETTEDETIVNEDAPLDANHAVDYSNGSADRIAIKNKVMQVTGLGTDLTESWVGNDGPGRVTADVHNPDKSKIYRVHLQYGDGEWHVTSYESLSSVPSN